MRPIILGLLAAFFFAFTFVLNASMELTGGSWIWSASLRYIFMLPILLIIVFLRNNLTLLIQEMKAQPQKWLLWSFVGFGLFYAPLTFAAAYAPGWLIASTWQITIISGALLSPLFYEVVQTRKGFITQPGQIPWRGLAMSLFILIGIVFIQIEYAKIISLKDVMLGTLPVLLASFAYPLGNRKMMEVCQGRLQAYERVLGMTIASLPFWLLLSIYGLFTDGPPSLSQTGQAFIVAITSGVIATVLFFMATDLVRHSMKKMAAVEATQSLEVLFALIGEVALLSIALPSLLSWLGIIFVIGGMIAHSYYSQAEHLIKEDLEHSV